MPPGRIEGCARPRLVRWLLRLLFRVMFTAEEQQGFRCTVNEVANDPRIPVIEITAKGGREYRRDEAAIRAACALCIKQSRANLGCELAYWLRK